MTADTVVRILDCLDCAGVQAWVEGGWGVDALLGRQTREHEDVDLAAERSACTHAETALAALGFQIQMDTWPRGVVLRGPLGKVDFHPLLFDERGNGWQQFTPREWGLYSAEGLRGRGTIAGREVACLTADLQLRHHAGYAWDATDWSDMRLLAERFDLALPPA